MLNLLVSAAILFALFLGAGVLSSAVGRRNARVRRLRQTWEAYGRTAHEPGEPLPPTRHSRLAGMSDATG